MCVSLNILVLPVLESFFKKRKEGVKEPYIKFYFYLKDALGLHVNFLHLIILSFESRAFLCKKHSSQLFSP